MGLGARRAVVVDNADPNSSGRLRVSIPSLFGENSSTGWIESSAGSVAVASPPATGSDIWVIFEGDDPSYPIWLAT